MEHVFKECDCDERGCVICEGGLVICEVCGLAEGSLTTECYGKKVSYGVGEQVYAGKMDFINGNWQWGKLSKNCPAYLAKRQRELMKGG